MKKFLLSLATIASGIFGANAATVTFDFTFGDDIQKMNPEVVLPTEASTGTNVNNVTFSLEGINITGTPGTTEARIWRTTGNAFQYRLYKNATMTVASDKTITEIKINSNAPASFSATGYSSGTWSGTSNSVVFSISGTVQITSITVTYDESGTGGGDPVDPNPGGDDGPVTPPAGETQTATYVASNQGIENGNPAFDVTINGVSFAFSKGSNSNPPTYYTTGAAVRCYGGNTFTVTAPTGATISKIVLTYGSGDTTAADNPISTTPGSFSTDTWTGSANEVVFTIGGTKGNRRIATINVTYVGGETPSVQAPVITCVNNTVSITAADNAKIYYTTDGNEPTSTSTEYTAPFGIEKNTIVKAIAYVGSEASNVTTYNAIYTVEGTLTVAKALELIEDGYNSTATVQGYITAIEEVSTQYGNATYTISDDLDASNALVVYRGYWLNGERFTAENQIEIGGLVTVEGTLTNYNGTYEFTTGNKVIEYEAPSTTDEPIDYVAPFDGQTYTIQVGEVWSLPLGESHPDDILMDTQNGEEFVSIDEDNLTVTGVAPGTAEFYVLWGANDTYTEGEAYFTIIVEGSAVTPEPYAPAFADAEYTMTIGEKMSLELGTTFPSDMIMVPQDESIIEINDETFEITALAVGTTVVDVVWDGDAAFEEGECSFTVTVVAEENNQALYTLMFGPENNQSRVNVYTSSFNVISNEYEWTLTNFNNNNTGLKDGEPGGDWTYVRCGTKAPSVATIATNFATDIKYNVKYIEIDGVLNQANSGTNLMNSAYIEVYDTNPSIARAAAIETVEIPVSIFVGSKNTEFNYRAKLNNTQSGLYYVITFDIAQSSNNGTFQINSVKYLGIDTAVETIDADIDATPVYYNLQGVRVNNPEKGLYIVVKGNKASKVIF